MVTNYPKLIKTADIEIKLQCEMCNEIYFRADLSEYARF